MPPEGNGFIESMVAEARQAVYKEGRLENVADWQRQVFLFAWLREGFGEAVTQAKKDAVKEIVTALIPKPPKNSRKDIVVRVGLPAVGGGGVLTLIVLEVLRILGA